MQKNLQNFNIYTEEKSQQVQNKRKTYPTPQPDKDISVKLTANIILNGERPMLFP